MLLCFGQTGMKSHALREGMVTESCYHDNELSTVCDRRRPQPLN
jgi:hypothetical protein